jgi:hypothetical protein
VELDDLADPVPSGPAELDDGRAIAPHRLDSHAAPLQRAVRGALEAAHCTYEMHGILADIRALGLKNHDLHHLLDAGNLVTSDLGAEVDGIGLALIQIEIVAEDRA